MKFHCNRCKKDFTTLAERDASKKFAFSHLIMDKMKCPNCGASNWHLTNKSKKKVNSRGGYSRGYAGFNNTERPEPNIIVHPDCRQRLVGDFYSPDGLDVCCDNCKSVFNCWTGNVDDGDYNAPLVKSIDNQREEAKIRMADKKRNDELLRLQSLRRKMGTIGFGYEFRQVWYARFGGTVWKLTNDDTKAISNYTWDTPQTIIIKRTFDNKGVNSHTARLLLIYEMRKVNKT